MNKRRMFANVREQIPILREKKLGVRRIAKSLSLARNTVRNFLHDYDNKKILFSESSDTSTTKEQEIDWGKALELNV